MKFSFQMTNNFKIQYFTSNELRMNFKCLSILVRLLAHVIQLWLFLSSRLLSFRNDFILASCNNCYDTVNRKNPFLKNIKLNYAVDKK